MRRAGSLETRRVLGAGTLGAGVCFAIAVGLDLLGRTGAPPSVTDVGALVRSVIELQAGGWAWLGVLALIAAPAVGLLTTAAEYEAVADRRTALTALGVLGILAISLVVALLR
jgi:hypothetical protein